MANYKTAKNLLGNRDTYSKYYGDFRGVDLSSDHALVNERRFSYAVNMYKDYLSGQSTGIETVPGFRKRVVIPDGSEIYGVHYFRHKDDDGNMLDKVLIHAGKKLYLWSEYPLTAGVLMSGVAYIEKPDDTGYIYFTVDLSRYKVGTLVSVSVGSDNKILEYTLSEDNKTLSFESYHTSYNDGDPVEITYYESELTVLNEEMNARKSISFIFNNRLYIIDGDNYLFYDGADVKSVLHDGNLFIPTTRARMVPADDTQNINFTVDGVTYFAKKGMTWERFINSAYIDVNTTFNFNKHYNGYIFTEREKTGDSVCYSVVKDASGDVSSRDLIKDDEEYSIAEYCPEIISLEFTIVRTPDNSWDDSYWDETTAAMIGIRLAEKGMTWKDFIESSPEDEKRGFFEKNGYVAYIDDIEYYVYSGSESPIKIGYEIYESDQRCFLLEVLQNGDETETESNEGTEVTKTDVTPSSFFESNADMGIELYQRNLLTDKLKNTFIATGNAARYYLSESAFDEDSVSIYAYGEQISDGYSINRESGYIEVTQDGAANYFQAPESLGYPEGYAGIEIYFRKSIQNAAGVSVTKSSDLITGCTIATIFDGRVFLSGNPLCPNTIFWCGANDTGYIDPTYFGILDNQTDGFGFSSIVGMMPVANTLLVLKEDSLQDGCLYFHTPYETGKSVIPVTYPSSQGLNGVGCLGAYTNFLDDPVFISRLGLDAVGQLSVRLERGREHRSSLIDAELLKCDLSKAVLEEWNGYLFVLVSGKIFLADSRQRFSNELGNAEYEWYYLEDIGVYDGQYRAYRYASELPPVLEGATVDGMPLEIASEVYDPFADSYVSLVGRIANNNPEEDEPPEGTAKNRVVGFDEKYNEIRSDVKFPYVIYKSTDPDGNDISRVFLVEESDEYIGGTFKPAVMLKAIGDNIYFWTQNGTVCSFNFDMRDKNGVMPTSAYTFDGRAIFSGCATKMDNCGIPHLTKTTVKKSTVIKLGALDATAAKIKVRTNREPYKQIARINSSTFSFGNLDFADLSFLTEAQGLFTVKEKEKKWVEKQYFIYSDEFKKPFALFYAAYRYYVAGRYKNQ